MAIRIIAAQVRLPVVAGKYEALMADVLEGPLPEEAESRSRPPCGTKSARSVVKSAQLPSQPEESTNPPEVDCSAIAAEATSASAAAASTSAVASSTEMTCDELTAEVRTAGQPQVRHDHCTVRYRTVNRYGRQTTIVDPRRSDELHRALC